MERLMAVYAKMHGRDTLMITNYKDEGGNRFRIIKSSLEIELCAMRLESKFEDVRVTEPAFECVPVILH